MRIGINGTGLVQKASIPAITSDLERAASDRFTSYWLAEHPTGGFDALTALAIAAQNVPDIEVGTAIIPTFPRHPMALAGQARTVSDALAGRLTLGIGLSHAPMMAQLGIGFDKPIRHLREYLSILMPLLQTGEVDFKGELLSCQAQLFQKPAHPCSVVVAALGPQALRVAGKLADGTTLAWVGVRTIREHIVPSIAAAADDAGRAAPRIVATLPVCVTGDPQSVRKSIDTNLSMYGQLPSYRAMFDREGVAGPGDVAIVGSAAEVEDHIQSLQEAGVTDFSASVYGTNSQERAESRELLMSMIQ